MIQLQMKYDALGRMDRQQQSDAVSDKERLILTLHCLLYLTLELIRTG
jgi:hypothetical protein